MSERIRLNVGGTYFETFKENLFSIPYFEALLLRWKDKDEEIFIDRSAIGFDHILNLLRNPTYDFPRQYAHELDYYGIEYTFSSNLLENIQREVKECKDRINSMEDSLLEIKTDISNIRGYPSYDEECILCNRSKICFFCDKCATCCSCVCKSCNKLITCHKCHLCYKCDKCKCLSCNKWRDCGQCGECNAHCNCRKI